MSVAQKINRPALRYPGGKWLLAPWIIEHFPPHRIYTEAFGGAASVLMQKPRCYAEVYNDLDGEVVNLFRILREPAAARRLLTLLALTPFSRKEFQLSYEPGDDEIEQARRTIIRSFMGFGSDGAAGKSTGFRANSNRSGTTPAQDWANYPPEISAFIERLQGVVIESRPACKLLRQHDGEETLHYVDPPYPLSTRHGKLYRHEMTDEDHELLAFTLHDLKGMVVLSGYDCQLYRDILFPSWQRVERRALADGARERIEVLWFNPAAWDALQLSRAQRQLFGEVPMGG